MAKHPCAARGCTRQIPPRFLMCQACWRMVPEAIQRRVWRGFRKGITSPSYLKAREEAIEAVARIQSYKRSPQQRELAL